MSLAYLLTVKSVVLLQLRKLFTNFNEMWHCSFSDECLTTWFKTTYPLYSVSDTTYNPSKRETKTDTK